MRCRRRGDRRGAGKLEAVLLSAGIAAGSVVALEMLGGETRQLLQRSGSEVVGPAAERALDGPLQVSVADASADETAGALSFEVRLNRGSEFPTSVGYSVSGTSADAGADFTAMDGRLRFAPGTTAATVSVPLLDDPIHEGSEQVAMTLAAPETGLGISRGSAVGEIRDDDPRPRLVLRDYGDVRENNTTITFRMELDRPAKAPVCFDLWTSNGSARVNADYDGRSRTQRCIAAGGTSLGFDVGINEDGAHESHEVFYLNADRSSDNLVIADGRARARILNDDAAPRDCPADTPQWSPDCGGHVSRTPHGTTVRVRDTGGNWTGYLDIYCNDGTWVRTGNRTCN